MLYINMHILINIGSFYVMSNYNIDQARPIFKF